MPQRLTLNVRLRCAMIRWALCVTRCSATMRCASPTSPCERSRFTVVLRDRSATQALKFVVHFVPF